MKLALGFIGAVLLAVKAAPGGDLQPAYVDLPKPAFVSTPVDLVHRPRGPHIDSASLDVWYHRSSARSKPFVLCPPGTTNIALGKTVTSSDLKATVLSRITDGVKDCTENDFVFLHKNLQWVQIDLGVPSAIYGIALWHDYIFPVLFRDVIVQISNDPAFTNEVRTLFNNDYDNSAGLGVGQDKEYFESHCGKLLDVGGQVARYARFYSAGSDWSKLNEYIEIEIYGVVQNQAEAHLKLSRGTSQGVTNLVPLSPVLPRPAFH